MKHTAIVLAAIFSTIAAGASFAEVEVRDNVGRVIEYRVQVGNMTKVYDGKRNFIYSATRQGNQYVYRDASGVIIGRSGPATISDPRGDIAKIREIPLPSE